MIVALLLAVSLSTLSSAGGALEQARRCQLDLIADDVDVLIVPDADHLRVEDLRSYRPKEGEVYSHKAIVLAANEFLFLERGEERKLAQAALFRAIALGQFSLEEIDQHQVLREAVNGVLKSSQILKRLNREFEFLRANEVESFEIRAKQDSLAEEKQAMSESAMEELMIPDAGVFDLRESPKKKTGFWRSLLNWISRRTEKKTVFPKIRFESISQVLNETKDLPIVRRIKVILRTIQDSSSPITLDEYQAIQRAFRSHEESWVGNQKKFEKLVLRSLPILHRGKILDYLGTEIELRGGDESVQVAGEIDAETGVVVYHYKEGDSGRRTAYRRVLSELGSEKTLGGYTYASGIENGWSIARGDRTYIVRFDYGLENELRAEVADFDLVKDLGAGRVLGKVDEYFAVFDYSGKRVTPYRFKLDEEVGSSVANHLIFAVQDGKHGVLDYSGKEVLPFQYDSIRFVEIFNRETGKRLRKTVLAYQGELVTGTFIGKQKKRFNEEVRFRGDSLDYLSDRQMLASHIAEGEGYWKVRDGNLFGVFSFHENRWLIPAKYRQLYLTKAAEFHGVGVYRFRAKTKNEKWVEYSPVLDHTSPDDSPRWNWIQNKVSSTVLVDSLVLVARRADSKMGTGRLLLGRERRNGVAAFSGYGVFNDQGVELTEKRYDRLSPMIPGIERNTLAEDAGEPSYNEKLFKAKLGFKYGVVDIDGREVLPLVYDHVYAVDKKFGVYLFSDETKAVLGRAENGKFEVLEEFEHEFNFRLVNPESESASQHVFVVYDPIKQRFGLKAIIAGGFFWVAEPQYFQIKNALGIWIQVVQGDRDNSPTLLAPIWSDSGKIKGFEERASRDSESP